MEYKTLAPNIGVKSVDETVKFYTEMLGFNLVMSVPSSLGNLQWAMVVSGGVTFMFQEISNLSDEYPQISGRPILNAMTFYLKMNGMRSLYEKMKNTDYLVTEMHKTFYGAEEFAIFDINGHILIISEDEVAPTTIKNYDNFSHLYI